MTALAQVPEYRTCGTPVADSLRRASHPELGTREDFEAWMWRKRQEPRLQTREVITIPVIVHVVHSGENIGIGNNISFAQIQSQIDVLNEDFRRTPGTPGFNNHPDGADTEIEFCLATIDPNGIPLIEVGVERINGNDKGWNAPPYTMGYADQVIKPASQWNPDKYFNMWVMPLTSGLLGFAQTPDASTLSNIPVVGGGASSDGVVMRPTSFGRVGNVNAPYNLGRTTTHEIGHWLGLVHTSGDGGCSLDDGCSDTPPTSAQNYGCPTGVVSCGQASMVENYLDYTDDACMNVFTECQKERMHIVLENSPRRVALLTSNACTQEVAPAAYFTADLKVLCAGQSVSFTDLSPNSPTGWTWSFPGGIPTTSSDQNPVVVYSQPGLYEVSLTVVNTYGSTQRVEQGFILVNQAGPSGLFREDFESGIPTDWTVVNPDGAFTWATRVVAGQPLGQQAAWVNCYQYPTIGQRDGLITPAIDLSYYDGVSLSFTHAYRRYADGGSAPSNDSLYVYGSTDGGSSFPHLLLALGESGAKEFATASDTSGLFIPKRASDWCFAGATTNCKSIDLSAFDGEQDFALKFETANAYGNAIFLDDVLLTGTCLITSNQDPFDDLLLNLYPNPATKLLTVEVLRSALGQVQVTCLDMQGRTMWQRAETRSPGLLKWEIPMHEWPAGIYVLSYREGNQVTYSRFIKE